MPLSIFRGIFSSSAAHRELPNNPPRERPLQEYLSHDDIDYSRFPNSIRNFKFPARPRDRRSFSLGGRDRRKTSQLQSTVHGFPRPLSFTDLIVFHHFHSKWKVNGSPPFRRSFKIKSSNDESQRGERRDSHRLTRDLFPPLVSADLCHNRQELAKARC